MLGNVNESGTDWEHWWCTIQKLTKNLCTNECELRPRNTQDSKKGIIGETRQCESGPEILKVQRSSIGDVWQCEWI